MQSILMDSTNVLAPSRTAHTQSLSHPVRSRRWFMICLHTVCKHQLNTQYYIKKHHMQPILMDSTNVLAPSRTAHTQSLSHAVCARRWIIICLHTACKHEPSLQQYIKKAPHASDLNDSTNVLAPLWTAHTQSDLTSSLCSGMDVDILAYRMQTGS